MVAGNLRKIEKRLDNATSELQIALEIIGDMNFEALEEEQSLDGINEDILRLGLYFQNIVSIKHKFESLAEDRENSQ